MLNYLIILLDDCSTSYCHYDVTYRKKSLMPIDILQNAIFFAMKENLMVQYVLPDYILPKAYKEVMDKIDSNIITSSLCEDKDLRTRADVIVLPDWTSIDRIQYAHDKAYVLKTTKDDFFDRYHFLKYPFSVAYRFNIVISDIEGFNEKDYERYRLVLSELGEVIIKEYQKKHYIQCNLITDRITIDRMNNCGAGETNITIAPNGRFYICPAFYNDNKEMSVGNLKEGIIIANPQLYKISHAPICRHCDAYHCKRCVWMNKKLTYEVNTPSKQQCVISHIERNISQTVLSVLRDCIDSFKNKADLMPINYLDPFDVRADWDKEFIEAELQKYHRENYL